MRHLLTTRDSSLKKIGANLLLFLVALATSVFLGEITIRILKGFSPKVAFLASIGKDTAPYFANSLEEYVRTPGFLLSSHGRFLGCITNSLGFNDVEFTEKNTEIIAIGDSFLFGRVSYPDNVITRLEGELTNTCSKKFEIANFGIAGLQPRDYVEVTRLALERYSPKTLLLHLYLGNDFPSPVDLDRLVDGNAKPEKFFKKYITPNFVLFRFIDNFFRSIGSKSNQPNVVAAEPNQTLLGGTCSELNEIERRNLTETAFQSADWFRTVNIEANRFYTKSVDFENSAKIKLELINPLREVSQLCQQKGVRLIAILYPSQFPLRPDLRKWFFKKRALDKRPLNEEYFDLQLPNRLTSKILTELGIDFVDTTSELKQIMDADATGQYYASGDTHWNELGNKAAAEVEGRLLKPLLCN
jgi:hypothetical protein